VIKILLTSLHGFRACRIITLKGSGGILCEAMAEVVGFLASGFTLACLFKVCLDAIDLIQTAQHQELDVKKLLLKLKIEKCRLYTWAEGIGLTTAPVASKPRPLDSCPNHVQDLVKDTLDMIIQLSTDTKKPKDRYGYKEIPSQTASSQLPILTSDFNPIENLAASFSHYRIRTEAPGNVARLTLKTRYMIEGNSYP
jgi:Prion-inhibition and propagation